jgi:Cof subfamily protein (haloacid dehalogenase superfamily)
MAGAAGKEFIDATGGDVQKLSGVFSQGLVVFGKDGKLIHESFLPVEAIQLVENYCTMNSLSVIAYAGDQIVTARQTAFTKIIAEYKEPIPELMKMPLHRLREHGMQINKLILLDEEAVLLKHRSVLDQHLLGLASITKAVPRMLEIIPFGASKGEGVRILLEHYGIDSQESLAFGDGENDIEMFQTVGYGVAVDNARPELKKHAKLVTLSNQEDGVAVTIEALLNQ